MEKGEDEKEQKRDVNEAKKKQRRRIKKTLW